MEQSILGVLNCLLLVWQKNEMELKMTLIVLLAQWKLVLKQLGFKIYMSNIFWKLRTSVQA